MGTYEACWHRTQVTQEIHHLHSDRTTAKHHSHFIINTYDSIYRPTYDVQSTSNTITNHQATNCLPTARSNLALQEAEHPVHFYSND